MSGEAFTAGAKWRKPDHMLGRHVTGLMVWAGLARSVRLDVVTNGLRRPRTRTWRHLRRDVEELGDVDRLAVATLRGRPLGVLEDVQKPVDAAIGHLGSLGPDLWHLLLVRGDLQMVPDDLFQSHRNPHRFRSHKALHRSLRTSLSPCEGFGCPKG